MDYLKHEEVYKKLKAEGHGGWGGKNYDKRVEGWVKAHPRFLEKMRHTQGKLLELGCGTGVLTQMLQEAGFEAGGIDVSETAIQWAREKAADKGLDMEFRVGSVADPAMWVDRKYDVVVDGTCLHCIIGEDRKTLLGLVYESLTDRGTFIVSSTIAKSESDVAERVHNPHISPLERCMRSEDQLRGELVEAGFEVIDEWVEEGQHKKHYYGVLEKK